MELLYMHCRDNARLGILVAVELQVFSWQRVTLEVLYMHFRDNARLGILVAVELQVFRLYMDFRDNARLGILVAVKLQVLPWQRVLRQVVATDTKYRILQGGVSYPGRRE
jgi:hypothetical protein